MPAPITHRTLVLATTMWVCACQVYDPSLVQREAGTDDAGDGSLRKPPPRPTDATGDDGEEYVFGLRSVVLDQSGERWREIGFDLDDVFTRAPGFEAECVPPRRGALPPADGTDGVDNVFGGELFPLVDLTVPNLETTARAAQDAGSLPALRIRGWNGEDNDGRVDVTITNAIFTIPAGTDGEPQPFTVEDFRPVDLAGDPFEMPAWDGTDYAYMRTSTFFDEDEDRPLLRDDNAYVSNRVLVVALPDRVEILFPAATAGVSVVLTDAVAAGRLSDDLTTIENLMVAGRWGLLDLLATAENVGVCRGSDSYNILSNSLNAIADVRSMPGSGGVDVPCDALSMGVAFTGTRMRWGGLTPGPNVENLCTSPMTDAGVGGVDAGMDAGVPDGG